MGSRSSSGRRGGQYGNCQRHGTGGSGGRRDAGWRGGLKQRRCGGLEAHGGLHARFVAAGNENPLELAAAELRRFGFERVFARAERGKAECAILRCGCANLGAGCLVAQSDGDANERSRMQIGKAAGKRT